MDISALEQAIGYSFGNLDGLRLALTHRSYTADHNERIEFLGDSVLNCVIAEALFQRFQRAREGDLSRLRANLVRQESLYALAAAIDLGAHLRLGEGETRSGGAHRPSILADALEAVFGAVFIDGGFLAARDVILRLYDARLAEIDPATAGKDPKTALQEFLQGRRLPLPNYRLRATRGAAHAQEFEVECRIPDLGISAIGIGASRRAAEQEAARHAIDLAGR